VTAADVNAGFDDSRMNAISVMAQVAQIFREALHHR
jgi:hypothetical protein